jgi:hypothetical protein
MANPRIVILEKHKDDGLRYDYILWADVPVARQPFYADPNAVSAWRDATLQQTQDLKDGKVVEEAGTISVAPGTNLTIVKGELEDAWARFQAEVTSANPWVRYGTRWDGTTWTNGGVA